MTVDAPRSAPELILYQTEDGRTRIECRFDPPPADPRVAHPDTRPTAEKKGAR